MVKVLGKIVDAFTLHWWTKVVETLIITALFVVICYFINPNDPFFMQGVFPWVILAPIFIALRYGTWFGLFSDLILVVSLFWMEPLFVLHLTTQWYFIFAMFLTTLVCGSFSDVWSYKLVGAQQLNAYAKEHLANLTESYYLLKISHDQLEQSLAVKPATLRKAYAELQQLLLDKDGEVVSEIAAKFMNLLEQYCCFSVAALYLISDRGLDPKPAASVGEISPLNNNDLLIRKCLEDHKTKYFAVNTLTDGEESDYLVVAPLRTNNDGLIGVLAISEISFWSLTKETLEGLAVLLACFANEQNAVKKATKLLKVFHDCPLSFARSYYRLVELNRTYGINSLLVVYKFPHSKPEISNAVTNLIHEQRTIDISWKIAGDSWCKIIVLKPFTYLKTIKERLDLMVEKYSAQNLSVKTEAIEQASEVKLFERIVKDD